MTFVRHDQAAAVFQRREAIRFIGGSVRNAYLHRARLFDRCTRDLDCGLVPAGHGQDMIDAGTMIARLPDYVRGRLRGRSDDVQLRHLAWLIVENGGDPCPPQAMDSAIDAWVTLGCPDPERYALCPLCAFDLTVIDDGLACHECDVTFGPTWLANNDIWFRRFRISELSGHPRDWWERPVRWDLSGPLSAEADRIR